MTIAHRIEPDLDLLYLMVLGYCTVGDILDHVKMMDRDPNRRPGMKVVIDLMHADMDVDLHEVKTAVAHVQKLQQANWEMEPTAFLTRNRMLESLVHAFELMVNETIVNTKVFSSLPVALRWLGLAEYTDQITELQARLLREFSPTR